MLTQLISSAWDDGLPASLSEEAFIVHNWLADGSPTVLACAESVHRRALFDAANEVLAELRSAPAAVPVRSSGAQQLSLLVQGMRQQRTAQLDLEGAVAQVLRALPAAGLRMPQASDAPFFPEVDDVGAIARAAWERLAHEWRAFGDDEWRQAVAAVGEEEEEEEEEEGEEGRAARAHALFWEGRRSLLLGEAELHETLWASLCEHISPPWEAPPQGSEVPPPPKRLPAALSGPADEPEADAEEEHEALGLVGHAAPRWYCRLHYEDWLLALEALPAAKTAPLRSARFFLSFALDAHGRASAHALYAAACGLMQLLSTLCELQVRGAPRAQSVPTACPPTACPLRSTRSSAPAGPVPVAAALHCYGGRRSTRSAPAGWTRLPSRPSCSSASPPCRASPRSRTCSRATPSSPSTSRTARASCCCCSTRAAAARCELPRDVLRPRVPRLQPLVSCAQAAAHPTPQVPLLDVLLSAEMDELSAYTRHAPLSRAAEEANWFTLPSAVRIYRQFLQLDTDHDGMLTPDELGRFDEEQHSLTPAFCNRLFEVVHTYEGRLDYKGYLDLVISLQALRPASAVPAAEAALRYFWRVLNLHDAPSLGSGELSYFARPAGRKRPLAVATARCPGRRLGRAPQAPWLRHGTWGEPWGRSPGGSRCGAATRPGRRRRLRGMPTRRRYGMW